MHCVSCLPGGYDGQSGNGKVSADVEDVPGLSHQTLFGVHHQQGHVQLPGGGEQTDLDEAVPVVFRIRIYIKSIFYGYLE